MQDHVQRVRVERSDRVAVVVIDNPPVNAGSREVRQGLLDSLSQIQSDGSVDAAVLVGMGPCFISGSDLKEFDGPLAEPQLPEIITLIERGPKPVVAALHGAALGGGYELALACDLRMAARGTLVGLPEVTLGMIPGAGGTQRLPRLVGIARAIDIVTTGRRVEASEAIAIGMIDVLVDGDLTDSACAAAAALAGKPRLLATDRQVPDGDSKEEAEAECRALQMGEGRAPIVEAIRLIRAASTLSLLEALREERAIFQQLRQSEEARSLRQFFFTERQARRERRQETHLQPMSS